MFWRIVQGAREANERARWMMNHEAMVAEICLSQPVDGAPSTKLGGIPKRILNAVAKTYGFDDPEAASEDVLARFIAHAGLAPVEVVVECFADGKDRLIRLPEVFRRDCAVGDFCEFAQRLESFFSTTNCIPHHAAGRAFDLEGAMNPEFQDLVARIDNLGVIARQLQQDLERALYKLAPDVFLRCRQHPQVNVTF